MTSQWITAKNYKNLISSAQKKFIELSMVALNAVEALVQPFFSNAIL